MKDGFIKIACACPEVRVADCDYNADRIIELIKEAAGRGVKIVCFPELSITGYTCGDLFLQETLLNGAERALIRIANETEGLDIVAIVGLPLRSGNKIYNCAAVISRQNLFLKSNLIHRKQHGIPAERPVHLRDGIKR